MTSRADLARRFVRTAAVALVPHTPGDDHTEPASRAVTAAVLRDVAQAQREMWGDDNVTSELDGIASVIEANLEDV